MAPPAAVAERLRERGIHVERAEAGDLPLVIATTTAAKTPATHAERGRWLWISAAPVPAARATDAVLRGAYDAISLARPGALDAILARIDEMLTPEPAAPPAAHLVQESAASRAVLGQASRPLTIPEILETPDGRSLAQSSVYRNLVVLEEAGLVRRVVTDGEFARYELAEDLTEHHHHLVCQSCGSVEDFVVPHRLERAMERAIGEIEAATGWRWAFPILALGPLAGILAIARLARLRRGGALGAAAGTGGPV